MIINLYKWLKNKNEAIEVGFIWWIVFGLIVVLAWGFIFGLVWGLVKGFFINLGVNIITTYPQTLPIWIAIIIFIIIVELLFLLDTSKPKKKENKMLFTCKHKVEATFEALVILVNLNNIRYLVFTFNFHSIIKYLGYGGIGIISIACIIGIIYVYIWINSLKY